MKKIKLILSVMFLFFITHGIYSTTSASTQQVSVSFQLFYDQLSPYGNWVTYSNYGYAWLPGVPGFRPYFSDGYWVFTDAGWMWVSYYDWGWAPFHYGTWVFDPLYGWLWVPGYNWSPAWVTW